ncbi:MAG: YtxH domain-containing protein [Bacteroidota bacterium]|nr:YtxH domain-containing protein [Bacteroidota bacterium]
MKKGALLLLTGIAVGVVAGLLLAPEEGSETRKKWMKKAKKYKKTLKDKSEEYTDKAADLKENIEGAVKDVKKRFS